MFMGSRVHVPNGSFRVRNVSAMPAVRLMAIASSAPLPTRRAQKGEGSISTVFSSLNGDASVELPQRFSDLKKQLWNDGMRESWREVLGELEIAVSDIAKRGSKIVPQVTYKDLQNGLSKEQCDEIKKVGTVIIKGGVPKEEALQWKESIKAYIAANSNRVKGFPEDNKQVFEIYNSKAQIAARTHPSLLTTQRYLLSLWHQSDPQSPVSLTTPLSYFDRLRIRLPGDAKFALGPHIDGGSLERWEDAGYRNCFAQLLSGDGGWRKHDSFDASPRVNAKQDLYNAPNQCSIFRPWQGWTSMSSTGPGEGTLRVFPSLAVSSAYVYLRPFFKARSPSSSSLKFEDWEVNLDGTAFPGSAMGKGQELNESTHPHMKLAETMVSIPRVEPGDQVYWHCDVIHAVESQHKGKADSSVLYIPAVPLTINNAEYVRDQRLNFIEGLPSPDFPGGEGESKFVGRATVEDVTTSEGRQLLGLESVTAGGSGNENFLREVGRILT